MPWPMVHFAVSEALLSGGPSPELLIGSIAPDAVHMRGHISREEKGVTHLMHNGQLPTKELIMEEYREYLLKRPESAWKDFVRGYFSHIYTDLRWTETVYAEFERSYDGDQSHIRQTYHVEVSQLEFELLRAWRGAEERLTRLAKAEGYSIDPFVTRLEIERYRDCKLDWLQDPTSEPQMRPIYFKTDKVLSFISKTAQEWQELAAEK